MIGRYLETILKAALIVIAAAAVACTAFGCVEKLSPTANAAIAQLRDQAAIDRAKAKADSDAAAAKADANTKALEAAAKARPASHPLEYSNLIVQEIHGPLVLIGIISTVLAFAGGGLWIAAKFVTALAGVLSTVATIIAPIAASVAIGCWAALWVAPIAFWVFTGTALLVVTLLVVQLAKAHWSIIALLGLHNSNVNAIKKVAKDAGVPVPATTTATTATAPPASVAPVPTPAQAAAGISFNQPGSATQPLVP